jgi:RNA polymerase sigma-70 factor (sigma-E family)
MSGDGYMSEAVYMVESGAGAVDTATSADGEAVSFEAFVAARGRDLWRSAWLLTGDAHKAEDLLQTALVKAWRRWPSIARDGAVEGYVRRALVTTYTDWWRRKWTGEVPTADLPEGARVDHAASQVELRRDVLAALATLSRGQRAVIVLRYFDDLTEAQTAEALGCSVGTVKSQTSRAMAALRTSPLLRITEDEEERS